MTAQFRWLVVPVIGVWLASAGRAQVVVPNIYENAEAPGSSAVLIHIQGAPRTAQLIYHENQLTGLVGQEITGIAYRRSTGPGSGYPFVTTTWADYVVRLGPSVAPAAATGTFASNFTASPTQVRSGSFTVGPDAWPNFGGTAPNPWGPEITFTTPYLYTGGHLAMLITHPGSDNPEIGNALLDSTGTASPGQGTDYSYYVGTGFDNATGSSSVFMTVVRFSAVTPVPEPASWLLGAVGVATAAALARRARRRGGKKYPVPSTQYSVRKTADADRPSALSTEYWVLGTSSPSGPEFRRNSS